MASQRRLEKLFWDLRCKYLAQSAERLVMCDIQDDIQRLKKYSGLSKWEKAALFSRAVEATDGEDSLKFYVEMYGPDISVVFS